MEINLQVKDICIIIDKCRKGCVEEFTYGPLHIRFGGTPEAIARTTAATPEIVDQIEKESKKAFIEDVIKYKQDQVDELKLTNPMLYEELLVRGDIENAKDIVDEE